MVRTYLTLVSNTIFLVRAASNTMFLASITIIFDHLFLENITFLDSSIIMLIYRLFSQLEQRIAVVF